MPSLRRGTARRCRPAVKRGLLNCQRDTAVEEHVCSAIIQGLNKDEMAWNDMM